MSTPYKVNDVDRIFVIPESVTPISGGPQAFRFVIPPGGGSDFTVPLPVAYGTADYIVTWGQSSVSSESIKSIDAPLVDRTVAHFRIQSVADFDAGETIDFLVMMKT